MSAGLDAEKVIRRLSQHLGQMAAELSMRDVALEDALARIAELEQASEGSAPGDD